MASSEAPIQHNLDTTCRVINHVYLPLETENGEIKLLLEKFSSVVAQSMGQVTGSKSINFPSKLDYYFAQAEEPPFRVLEEFRQFLVSLTDELKSKLDAENRNRPDDKYSLLIIEFWRTKAMNLNTLYQELSKPEVGRLKSVLLKCTDDNLRAMSQHSIEAFDNEMKELIKSGSEAKDNVKFLNTLERQFKNLKSNDFSVIEKTLPSLLKGLKVVFTISRHFKSDQKISSLLITISNELCNKIQSLLNLEQIFQDIRDNPDEAFLDAIKTKIVHGKNILFQWKTLFEKTKEKLEEEGGDRWDFDQKPIKERPEHMIKVLESFRDVIDELKKFVVLLGPRLKAVTGSTDRIDELISKVKSLSNVFIGLSFDPYDKNNWQKLRPKLNEYNGSTKEIQEKTIKLIETTFADLRSSESAFELLQKFINLQSLDHISEQLHRRYSNVLTTYQKELNLNKELFEKGRGHVFFAKSQPPIAGAIIWKRAIMHRIKTPIVKFVKRSEEWNPDEMKFVKEDYKSFAKQLDAYEKDKLEVWVKGAHDRAIRFLKEHILVQVGKFNFQVNFPEDFKVLISEAKHLDTLGYQLPKTVLNIALQEKEYFKYVDRLSKLVDEYHAVVGSLSDIEQYLYASHLRELTANLSPVLNSFNLNTLGIYDFINSYREHLKHFVEMKNKVDEKKRMIEDILHTIESAEFIDASHFERVFFPTPGPNGEAPELDTLAKFYSVFESEIEETVTKLTEKYRKINETMLPQIEFAICKKQTGTNPAMKYYYQYWERRVYNSITKMIVRALLCLKAMLNRPNHRPVPIFKVQTEFHYMKVITIPHQNEIRVTLNNLLKLVKDSAIHFPRWKPGTCHAYSPADEGFEGEERPNFTFLRDINDNTVIKLLTVELSEIKKLAFSRLEKYKSTWEEDKGGYQDMYSNFKRIIWNQKNKFKIDKILEKNPTTANFEFFIEYFSSFLRDFEAQPAEVSASFILVDFTNVKQSYITQCKEALARIGAALLKIADKKTTELAKQVQNYNRMIDQEADTLNELKVYLNLLTEIRDSTMDFEFKLEDLEERYKILAKYGLMTSQESFDKMRELRGMWTSLLKKAFAMDRSLRDKKQSFADQTTQQVRELQEEISELHKEYFKRGPGCFEITLEKGAKAIAQYAELIDQISKRKVELVTSQKLFNLEISNFPKLVEIEEDLRKLGELYDLFNDFVGFVDKYSKFQWIKVDFGTLDAGKKKYLAAIKKLGEANPNVVAKIKQRVEEFAKTLPIIEKLKCSNSFKDYHWEKLLTEIGFPSQDINFKSITLQNVFGFKLQDHLTKVDEVVNMSVQEGNNEDIIKGIEAYWKSTSLEIVEYRKQGEKKGSVVKVSEDINLSLNDHLINLQNMEGSKYALALKGSIKTWVAALNTIMETLEVWIAVQRKWMYLESIFIGNEDMRQQLPKEAKNFENLHKTFKKINEQAIKNPNIFVNCVQIESTLPQLKSLAADFDKSQKSLSDYLNSKKICFPRFYFISDDDLLSILGSSECGAITPHLMKLYDNCKALDIENNKLVKGMTSEEGEAYQFKEPVKPEGAVETWMSRVEAEMVRTLRDVMKEGVFHFAKMEKKKWIAKYLGMVVLAGVQIWWTWRVEDAFRKVHEGNKYALKAELEKQSTDLKDLIDLVRSDLEAQDPKGLMRKKINTLIIIEVHQRDIVDRFVRDSILDVKEFGWESQLRFYWQQSLNDMQILQCAGKFAYGYEYQGLNGRLVITPLTDRCVMTLTTALSFHLGGAPAGPAGTGKTETCKDLAKSLAMRCIVTNCGENFDSFAMGNNFSGLCQTGFWGCFDEFNRINPDVLSVVSAQIKNIQNSLNMGKKTVSLMNQDLNLIPTIGIFVTMNPGYEGRSELPDNLKALFRPVVMVVPDNNIICENMLMSEGFVNARVLAKKMTVLYKLSREQLSKQYHYDFGLRALKSVLVMAGSLKRASPDVSEDKVLMRALRDMNLPKFVNEDIGLFLGLINDLFPGLQIDAVSRKDLQQQIEQTAVANGFTQNEKQVAKVIQLFETMLTRHTTMVVGPTSVGKTTIIELLQKSQTIPGQSAVTIYPINPKAQSLLELYGDMDVQTRDWTDGILSKIFKLANEETEEESSKKQKDIKWILLDGDVDAVWIENMNSVMDDNKLLTLSNGDRIRLKPTCKLLFEVSDLQFASPATISRCGMVYVDDMCLNLSDYFNRWVQTFATYQFESDENILTLLAEMYKKYIPPLVSYLFEGKTPNKEIEAPLRFIVERTPLNLLQQLTTFFKILLPETVKAIDANAVESLFIFALVWSFGACLVSEDREKFIKAIRDLSSILLPNFSLFDGFYDLRDHSFLSWEYKLSEESIPPNVPITRVLIPTTDTVRYNYVLREFESKGFPIIFVGDSGTAKTVIIENYLKTLDLETRALTNLNFSSRTSSLEVQRTIEGLCDKRRPGLYCPKGNKKLVVFVDELHMPQKDKYNTQQPIALLRFLLEKGVMYERGGQLEKRRYTDINFVSALLPHAGGYNKIDPRFLSLFNMVGVVFPDQANVEKIYNTILTGILDNFPKECKEMCGKITTATLQLYNMVVAKLPRTPIKFHYVFNLRDLSKIYQGLAKANLQHTSQPLQLARLWRNECTRIFSDRLMTLEDLTFVNTEAMKTVVAENFDKTMVEEILRDRTIFCEFMDCNPSEPGFESAKLYKEVPTLAEVKTKIEDMLEAYNLEYSGKEMNLVIFSEAVEHMVRLLRVLSFHKGHAMLVGFGGSGKQSLTRLATFIIGFKLFTITFKRNYKESNFKEDLLDLFLHGFSDFKPAVFMLSDVQIAEESFLELVNTLLTVGVPNSLFDEGAKNEIKGAFRDLCKKETGKENGEEVWDFFCEFIRNNLHVVLCMSPAGESLRVRARNFPGLVSSTSIDWFFTWPREALEDVARHYLKDFELEAEMREKVQRHMVWVHSGIPAFAEQFYKHTGRNVYSTPKNFLDFLNNFKRFFEEAKKSMDSTIVRYETGLEKLVESAEKIGVLRESIGEEKAKVEVEKQSVEVLLTEIREKTAIATEKQTQAKEKQDQLAVENLEIKQSREEADQILNEKLPALEVARQKVSEIKKNELDYIRALPSPPKLVQITVLCLQILRVNSNANENEGWAGAKTMLSDTNLVNQLIEFSKDESKISKVTAKQIKMIDEKLKAINDELTEKQKTMNDVSPACAKLLFWVDAVKLLYDTNQIIKPLKEKVERLTKAKAKKEEALQETTALLKVLTDELSELNDKKVVKERVLNDLTEKVEAMEAKLFKAEKLISDLEGERVRWGADKVKLAEKLKYLYSSVLLGASFVSYSGPFDQEFRRKMSEKYKENLRQNEIILDEEFKIEGLLSSEIEVSIWNSQGLPADELSVQNGILTTRASRYPLCVDPQLQAVTWLKKKEEKNLVISSFNDEANFARALETCLKFKKVLLIENVNETTDPLIDSILEKNFIVKGGRKFIKLDNVEIEFFEKEFQLYMVTRLLNPRFAPEIFGKTSVVNYNVTFNGLKEQLLSEVVGIEQEEKERLRKQLISDMSEDKKTLMGLEEMLLMTLVNSTGSLLENEQLLTTLEKTKKNSSSISESLEKGNRTRAQLEEIRQAYVNAAIRGAVLFFTMQKLSAISEMYQYSLSSYLEVFRQSIGDAKPESILTNRINNIIDKLTHNTYDYVLLGIFERHKLMFAFQMTVMIIDQEGGLNQKEFDFLIKGNTSFEESAEKKALAWMSDAGWKDLLFLNSLEAFTDLIPSILENEREWKAWFDSEDPEDRPLPKPYEAISKFQTLLLLRVFRTDRIINGVKRFIIDRFKGNEYYVSSPTINYRKILHQSNERAPIVFILSPGADPINDVQVLANNEGFSGNKFKFLSLGQNMEKEAEELIVNASQRGHWAMLQNCDLLPNWLKTLEKLLENLVKGGKISKDFRLWLTTKPTQAFPLGILQNAMKIVTEPPDGLRFNMKAIAAKLTDENLAESVHFTFRPLAYVLCFFHAILLDRRKYGKIGFNVTYDFNESDFRISFKLLGMYLNKSIANKDEEVPWESLKYLIGEAMYGGRVTDEFDRRVLSTYLDEYMGDFLFDADNSFAFAHCGTHKYRLPEYPNTETLLTKINELPIIDSPNVFGLNLNSEITYYSNSAKSLFYNLLVMQSVDDSKGSMLENGDYLLKVTADILEKVPEVYPLNVIKNDLRNHMTPIIVFLVQEVERFNFLIEEIKSSLKSLTRALHGEIILNNDLEALAKSLLNGFLPARWRRLAPQTEKNLSSWMLHFRARTEQYDRWLKQRDLPVIWISGLHFPEAYLTALVQNTCRLKQWALDKSTLFTTMTSFRKAESVESPPEDGAYIYGLYMEGASWSTEKDSIVGQQPKQLITELPVMQINPVEITKLKMKDTIKVPVYVTQNRRNAAGVGHIFDADMKTIEHASHWILQGIAIVLNTDQ